MEAGPGRIQRLVELGQLREKRARRLIAALQFEDARRELPPADLWTRLLLTLDFRTPPPAEILESLYLSGRIDGTDYLRRLRRLSGWLAVAFFGTLLLAMALTEFLDRGRRVPPDRVGFIVLACALGAVAIGAVCLAGGRLIRRRLDRLRRLAEATSERQP